MQSGITASSELHDAFNSFVTDASLFALPVTITGESLTPLSPLPFKSSDFTSSLSTLAPHLQPKTPIYLILRPSPSTSAGLIPITYVPSVSPVRSKMLFASTRATLARDLGLEKFAEGIFATDAEDILDAKQWEIRTQGAAAQKDGTATDDILSKKERELQNVKRAEEEERHGTSGRDLMGSGGSGGRLAMKISSEAQQALGTLSTEGALVILGIDMSAGETLELLGAQMGVQPAAFLSSVPHDRPSYAFFHYPSTEDVVFLYTCPSVSKVRERMVYASARASVLQVAKGEGVNVTKRLEAGDVDEITEGRLAEEVGAQGTSAQEPAVKQGFARPKRPGKR